MSGCTILIGLKMLTVNRMLTFHDNSLSRKRKFKKQQITYLLILTNLTFFFMVSPLVVLNAIRSIDENMIKTTIVYFLSYSNHG